MKARIGAGHVYGVILTGPVGVIVTHRTLDAGWISVGPRHNYAGGLDVGWLHVLADYDTIVETIRDSGICLDGTVPVTAFQPVADHLNGRNHTNA